MPTAGAVIPPVIIALRKPVAGVPSTHIDTSVFLDLESETPDCRLYFTSDGTKPNPFQPKYAGREVTFKYKGPFTLKTGKRTIKAVAVSGDGRESNVVTKTFVVDDAGPPNEDDPLMTGRSDFTEESDGFFTSSRTLRKSTTFPNKKKKTLRKSTTSIKNKLNESRPQPKQAWIEDTSKYSYTNGFGDLPHDETHHSSVELPDGTYNPTNYSGTQINFWGVSPNAVPQMLNSTGGHNMPYGNRPNQLGLMTESMIRGLEPPKPTIEDVKRMLEEQRRQQEPPPQPPPQPAIVYPAEPELTAESPGNGDWKGNLKHIYAHLIDQCNNRVPFRTAVGNPKLGKIQVADFDEEDDAFLLTVSISKTGLPAKPKPKPPIKKVVPPTKAATKKPEKKEEPKPKPKPKPKVETKPPKPKEDPYFETEEYEDGNSVKNGTSKHQPLGRKLAHKYKPRPTHPSYSPRQSNGQFDSLMETDTYFCAEEFQQEGTLKPWEAFNAERDCEVLRKAMKGLGTDEKAIIDILGYRSSVQREEVCTMFKTMFGKDLRKELDGETSGNFSESLLALCMPACDYDASEIRKAVKGLGTDDDALIEILCTRTNKQIEAMKEAYKRLYGKEMEKDVRGDTSGHFKKLLTSQIQANREENPTFDRTAAKQDARALYEAGEKKWGTDESTFNMILCQRSFPHLRAVFEEYATLSKKNIEEVIKSEFSGDIKNGLLTVVRCIKDKPGYFARKLEKAMKGLGTDDSALIRVVVSRCECDMVQIMEAFQKLTNGTLADWIADDISGDYKELLFALIGARAAPVPTAEDIAEAEAEPELEEVEEEQIEEDGTLKPADPFDPNKDCEVLKKAMKGFGTDEAAIINVVAKRSCEQRLELIKQYKTMYGKDLVKEIKSETSGNFWQALKSLLMGKTEFDAYELRKAMKGLGTDEDCLIEILCTRSSEDLAEIVNTYKQVHNRKLEDDIISETSGHLKRLLVSMVQANRPDTGNTIDRRKARKDAQALFDAGEKSWGTDESRFNVILCSRSYPQLRATFEEYEKLSKKDIEDAIKSEMSGDIKNGMLTIVRCVRNKSAQFAKRLQKSMAGLGTDDDTLIRIIVSRCEVDMVQIKQHFQQAYKQRLGQYIADDTSGDYKKTLLTIIAADDLIKK